MSTPRAGRTAGAPPASAESIRREAIRLFGERTYPVIGMRDLSEAVGILPGSLYAHITSKEALLLAIVEEGIHRYLDAIAPHALARTAPSDRLRGAIQAHLQVLEVTREQTRVAFGQWEYLGEDNRARVLVLRKQYLELFTTILQDGVDDGSFRRLQHPTLAALSVIGVLNAATEWFDPQGPASAQEVADALADNAIYGIVAPT